MPNWLGVTLLIFTVLAVALAWDKLRQRQLQRWVVQHQAVLHWPVDLAQHPDVPAKELAARFESQGARRWASALQSQIEGRSAWVLEYEATPRGRRSGQWYSLCLINMPDPASAQALLDARRGNGAQWVAASGTWFAERHEGLMTADLMERWFRQRDGVCSSG